MFPLNPNAMLPVRIIAVLVAVACLAASGQVDVPLRPVPITLQTFAVTLTGALLGARLGVIAVVLWLLAGALGAPVLAGGTGGVERFAGASAGYLYAFPIAAALVGWLAERGWTARPMLAFAAMLLGNAVCLVLGAAWLGWVAGGSAVLRDGVLPFLTGALLKSSVAALIALELSGRAGTSARRRR